MPTQSTPSVQTPAQATSGPASTRNPGGGRGNAAAAERLDGVATGREPGEYAVEGAAVTHAVPQANRAFNAGAAATDTVLEPGEREVRVLHTAEDPLCVSGSTPATEDLYEERPLGAECDPAWQAVTRVRGSVESPVRAENLLEGSIFVGGGPSVEDVQQGQIGDCYLLAGLIGLVAADPQRISYMIQVSGQAAVVSFFRLDPATAAWVPTAITVSLDLAHRPDAEGRLQVNGAGFRRSELPARSEWYADESFDALWVNEDAYYEAALWVPLIEKAYARFAERYGQYGGGASQANSQTDGQGKARSGYEVIEGGFAQAVMKVLCGEGVESLATADVNWAPGVVDVAENKRAILRLLYQRDNGQGGVSAVMTVAMGGAAAVQRLGQQVAVLLGSKALQAQPDFATELRELEERAAAYAAAPAGDEKKKAEAALADFATAMAAPGAWPILRSGSAGGELGALDELLLIVANLGEDNGTGPRHTYADHEYAVEGAQFRDKRGAELAVSRSNIDATIDQIDPLTSLVRQRNPHGGNSPDSEKSSGASAEDNGAFSLTLGQFFRSFDTQQSVLLK